MNFAKCVSSAHGQAPREETNRDLPNILLTITKE